MKLTTIRTIALTATAACAGLGLAADDQAKFLPEGPGKELVVRICTDCHGVDSIRKKRLGSGEWAEQVGQMVDNGAKATGKEQAAIVEYLSQTFGEDAKVYINSAPLTELKAVLGFTVNEASAVISYRKEHGEFKEWGDLLKVPGVDTKKVEAKKDLLAF